MTSQQEAIVELHLGCTPEAAISGAVLVQTEISTFSDLQCHESDSRSDWNRLGRVDACTITKFGYPNDEAWDGIPRTSGLNYGIFEVRNSKWKREIIQCFARDMRLEIIHEPYEQMFSRITKRDGRIE